MSIRPIEYQGTLLNSLNEARTQHNEYNKIKENNQFLEKKLEIEVKRNQQKVKNTEECSSKKVTEKKHGDGQKKKSRDQRENENSKKENKIKGQNLDIFI